MTSAVGSPSLRRYDWGKGIVASCLMVALVGYLLNWTVQEKGDQLPVQAKKMLNPALGGTAKQEKKTAVAISHPIVSSPKLGDEIELGINRFGGFAEPGTRVVLFGDNAEMGSGEAKEDGTWVFDADVQAPLPDVFSVKFYDDGGQVIHSEPNLLLTTTGSVDGDDAVFAIVRPIDKGSVAKGSWVIAGTGKPGSRVRLQLDRFVLGETLVEDDGTWKFPRTVNEAGVKRELIAREIDGFADEILSRTVRVVE